MTTANATTTIDTGPLSWVIEEVRQALDSAVAGLRSYSLNTSEITPLRVARTHLHQAHGALQMVDLDGVPQVTALGERVFDRYADAPSLCSADVVVTVERAFAGLIDYLDDVLAGQPHQPVRLFPQYRELAKLIGIDRAHPADLFFPRLGERVPDEDECKPVADPSALAPSRAMYERGLLKLLRNSDTSAAAAEMSAAVRGFRTAQTPGAARSFWTVLHALCDSIAEGAVAPTDLHLKRLAARVNLQMRRAVGGQPALAERLLADALFHLSTADSVSPEIDRVRRVYRLAEVPRDFEVPRYGRVDARVVKRAREQLGSVRASWDRYVGGKPTEADSLLRQARLFAEIAVELAEPGISTVSSAVVGVAETCVAAPGVTTPDLAIETATAILFLEHGLETFNRLSPEYAERAELIAARLRHALAGEPSTESVTWLAELSREAHERSTMTSLVGEIQTNLRAIEQALDAFFRDPTRRDGLGNCAALLAQGAGALSMLGHDSARLAMDECRAAIERFSDPSIEPDPEEFGRVAQTFGALGFVVDSLRQPTGAPHPELERDPQRGGWRVKATEPASRAAVTETVPSAVHAASPAPQPATPDALELAPLDFAAPGGFGAEQADEPVAELTEVLEVIEPAEPESARALSLADAPAVADSASVEAEIHSRIDGARAIYNQLSARPDDGEALAELQRALVQIRQDADLIDDSRLQTAAANAIALAGRTGPEGSIEALGLALASLDHHNPASLDAPAPDAATLALAAADDDTIDAEILDIFLEEAREVLDTIDGALGRCKGDPGHVGNLTVLRRGFHTLKGSSRMVGLRQFGEAAWALEQVYNVWLAEERPGSTALYGLTHAAHRQMGSWIDQIAAGQLHAVLPERLIAAADRVRTGDHFFLTGERTFAAPDSPIYPAPPIDHEPGFDLDFNNDDGLQPIDPPAQLPAEEAAVPEVAQPTAVELSAGRDAAAASKPVLDIDFDTMPDQGGWPVLNAADALADDAAPPADDASVPPTELPAIDVPDAVLPMADQPAIDAPPAPLPASVAAIEQLLRTPPGPDELADVPTGFLAGSSLVRGMAHVPEPRADDLPLDVDLDPFAPEASAPDAALPDPVDAADASDSPVAPDERRIGPLVIATQLYEIYLAEADDCLRVLQTEVARWRDYPDGRLQEPAVRAVHSLAGCSATAGVIAVHELAASAEKALQSASRAQLVPRDYELDTVDAVLDGLAAMLHRFAAGLHPEADAGLLARAHELALRWADEAEAARRGVGRTLLVPSSLARDELGVDLELELDIDLPDDDAARSHAAATGADGAPTLHAGFMPKDAFSRSIGSIDLDLSALDVAAPSPASGPAPTPLAVDGARDEPPPAERADDSDLPENEIDADLIDIFIEEGRDYLPRIESGLHRLIAVPTDPEALGAVLRALHTVKGSARMAGAMRLGALCHAIESRAEAARDQPTSELFEELMHGFDMAYSEFARLSGDASVFEAPPPVRWPAADVFALSDADDAQIDPDDPVADWPADGAAAPAPAHHFRWPVAPLTNPDGPSLAEPNAHPGAEPLSGAAVEPDGLAPTGVALEATAELAPGLDHASMAMAVDAGAAAETAAPEATEAPLESDAEAASLASAGTDAALADAAFSPPFEPAPANTASPAGSPAASPASAAAPAAAQRAARPQSLVRVRSDVLDRLVNNAGEVSIARSRLENDLGAVKGALGDLTENVGRLRGQLREMEIAAEAQMMSRMEAEKEAGRSFDPLEFDRFSRLQELTRMLAESVSDVATLQQNIVKGMDGANKGLTSQARLTRELQEDLMRVRMVPFDSASDRLYRVVRQSAKEVGKRVNLEIRGATVELDRGVLERMTGAFEHLLRNAVVHGIEPGARRVAAGKPEAGTIVVSVRQRGNEIELGFDDDGAGIDLDAVRAKAIAKGMLAADGVLGDAQAAELVFAPGFTTANEVTALAGRGVGMDVVRAEAGALGGRVQIDNRPGQGVTFTIRLPLTLAVTQVVLIRAGGRMHAVPAVLVGLVQQLRAPQLAAAYADGVLEVQGRPADFAYLPALLGDRDSRAIAQRYSPVITMESGGRRVALHVDEVVGNQEVVVKNIGPQLARMVGITGATVLGSGDVVLIIDPVQLIERLGAMPQQAPVAVVEAAPTSPTLVGAEDPVQEAPVASDASNAAVGTGNSVAGAAVGATGLAASPAARPSGLAPIRSNGGLTSLPVAMVVDDSVTVRRVTQRLLQREGYQVVLAKDGVDALEQLQEFRPDVMLVDIEMPRMDGFDLTRNVRGDPRIADVPIVMITSRTADKHRNHALELGVNAYLGKPYRDDELVAVMRELIAAQAATVAGA